MEWMIKVPQKSTRMCSQRGDADAILPTNCRRNYADRVRLSNRTWWFSKDTARASPTQQNKERNRICEKNGIFYPPSFSFCYLERANFSLTGDLSQLFGMLEDLIARARETERVNLIN